MKCASFPNLALSTPMGSIKGSYIFFIIFVVVFCRGALIYSVPCDLHFLYSVLLLRDRLYIPEPSAVGGY